MKNFEIKESLREMTTRVSFHYDVIPSDYLCHLDVKGYPLAVVVNTDPSYFPGKHWVVLYQKTQYSEIEGFDRYVTHQ